MLLEQLVLRLPHPHPSSGPTHCHPHHCAYCVRYHKVRLSTVWSRQGVCMYHRTRALSRTVNSSDQHEHTGAQTCHTTASRLIEHTHTGLSSTSTGTGGSAPPHMLSGSANDPALVTLLTVPGTITFTLVYTLRGATRSRRGDVCA